MVICKADLRTIILRVMSKTKAKSMKLQSNLLMKSRYCQIYVKVTKKFKFHNYVMFR